MSARAMHQKRIDEQRALLQHEHKKRKDFLQQELDQIEHDFNEKMQGIQASYERMKKGDIKYVLVQTREVISDFNEEIVTRNLLGVFDTQDNAELHKILFYNRNNVTPTNTSVAIEEICTNCLLH